MRIEIKHPAFKSQRLSVETASILAGPKLLLNGVVVKRKGGSYLIASDSGEQVKIQVKYNFLDPIPKVKIGDAAVELAKPLQWFEYAWIGVPMLLVFAGGALGGFVGAGSTVINGRIFRSDRGALSKYALAAGTSVAGTAVFFVIAVAIQIAHGVNVAKFTDAFRSFNVNMISGQAEQRAVDYRISGVPTLAIAGKYTVDGEQAKMLTTSDQLIAMERGAEKKSTKIVSERAASAI